MIEKLSDILLEVRADLRHGELAILSGVKDPGLGAPLAELLGVPHYRPVVKPFGGEHGSGEYKIINPRIELYGKDVVFVISGPHMDVLDLLILGQLLGCNPSRITVIMAYFPYSRSDKNEDGMFHLTTTVINLLKGATDGQLRKIICLDLHSPGTVSAGRPGLITVRTMARELVRKIVQYLGAERIRNVVLVAADAGSVKRLGKELQPIFRDIVEEELGIKGLWLPMAEINKERQEDGSVEIKGISGASVCDMIPVMIDDECASASTLGKDSYFLVDRGALSSICAVSHPVLSNDAVATLNDAPIEFFVVGDTISVEGKEVECMEVVSGVPVLAEAVRAWHQSMPVSQL